MGLLWWCVLVMYVLGGTGTVAGLLLAGWRAGRQHRRLDEALSSIEQLIRDTDARRHEVGYMTEEGQAIGKEAEAEKKRILPTRLMMGTVGYAADYAERTLYAELKAPATLAIGGVLLGTAGSVTSLWL